MSVFDEGIHQSVRMGIRKDFQSIRALGILSMKYEGMGIRTSQRPIPIF